MSTAADDVCVGWDAAFNPGIGRRMIRDSGGGALEHAAKRAIATSPNHLIEVLYHVIARKIRNCGHDMSL